MSLESFIDAYVEAMLWAECDYDEEGNGGTPFEDTHGPEDIHADSMAEIRKDCEAFYDNHRELWEGEVDYSDDNAGFDFYLSRNGHGAGFFDRDIEHADELQDAARVYSTQGLTRGDVEGTYLVVHN